MKEDVDIPSDCCEDDSNIGAERHMTSDEDDSDISAQRQGDGNMKSDENDSDISDESQCDESDEDDDDSHNDNSDYVPLEHASDDTPDSDGLFLGELSQLRDLSHA